MSYVLEEIIVPKIKNNNFFQMTATKVNSMAANPRQRIQVIVDSLDPVNGAPHERVLANVPPKKAHLTGTS